MGPVMTLPEETSSGVVALLLDDIAAPRLGTLLRAARKQRSLTRRDVANRVDTTAGELRRYERGDAPVPPSLVAQLAECYGEDLTAQFTTRAPVQVEGRQLMVGSQTRELPSTATDDVLGTYVAIVARLRRSQPGAPIALRADDVVALSSALGLGAEQVESRIVELLGCTPHEAHSLHSEMLRRKLVVPVAGLVAGLAVVTGVGVGVASASTNTPAPPAAHSAPAPATHVDAVPTTVAPAPTTPVTAAPAPTPAAPPSTVAPAPDPAPVAEPAAAPTPTTEPAAEETTPAVHPLPRPVITTDTTPMSVPPHETVTIIQP